MATLQSCFWRCTFISTHKSGVLHSAIMRRSSRGLVVRGEQHKEAPMRSGLRPLGSGRGNRSSLWRMGAADSATGFPTPEEGTESSNVPAAEEQDPKSVWQNWRMDTRELRAKVSKWGLAAVLAYGLFDGITYTTFFVLAFLSYEKSTGQNPAANLKALLGVVVLMWGGNNVTRPFRVAGAAALAPFIDRGLKKMQEVLKLPSQAFAFMVCVATFACACFSVVAVLVLSRLGR